MNGPGRRALVALTAAALMVATCAIASGKYSTRQAKGEHYRAGVKYKPSIQAGYETRARLYMVATDGWHMNEKFPYKVTLTVPDGVSAAKTTFKKSDAVVFNDSKIVFKIPYEATEGTHTIKAKINLAVCKKDQCVPHTETLSWTVEGVGGQ